MNDDKHIDCLKKASTGCVAGWMVAGWLGISPHVWPCWLRVPVDIAGACNLRVLLFSWPCYSWLLLTWKGEAAQVKSWFVRPVLTGLDLRPGRSLKGQSHRTASASSGVRFLPLLLLFLVDVISVVTNQTQARSIVCGSVMHVLHMCEKLPEDWRRPWDCNGWPDFSGLFKWTILRVSHLFHNFLILQFSSLYKYIVDLNLRIHN